MEHLTEALVKIWDKLVGVVSWDERREVGRFQYADSFLATGLELSPIMMPLSERTYEFPELREFENTSNTFLGLPGLLADSLPEKYGNNLMQHWLTSRNIEFKDLNPVERLCYVGKRGMGALEFEPAYEKISSAEQRVSVDELVAIAQKVLTARENAQKRIEDENLLDCLIEVGTSAGGAKAKAIVALAMQGGKPVAVYSGQGAPRKELSYWILKFSDVSNSEHLSDKNTGNLEYAYYCMAKNCGIQMTNCQLLPDNNGVSHFITQRFDRINGKKVHMQTFCALAHEDRNPVGNTSYEKLFATARKLNLTYPAMEQLYRRMVFNILARNQDDHSKNHSFLMDQYGNWALSPAYDLTFSYKKDSRFVDKQQMRCNNKRDDFTLDDLLKAAKSAEVTNPARIIREVQSGIDTWEDCAKKARLPEKQAAAIRAFFRRV